MTKEEIKIYLKQKFNNYVNQAFDDEGDAIHLAVIVILSQIIQNYESSMPFNLSKLSMSSLDELIEEVEEQYLFDIQLQDITEVIEDYSSNNSCCSLSDYIERKLYWLVADIVDIEKEIIYKNQKTTAEEKAFETIKEELLSEEWKDIDLQQAENNTIPKSYKFPEELELLKVLVEKSKSKMVLGIHVTHEGHVGYCPNCENFVSTLSNPLFCLCGQKLSYGLSALPKRKRDK